MQRPSVVLPEPDSPTRPTLSFRPTSIDTSRSACDLVPARPANTLRDVGDAKDRVVERGGRAPGGTAAHRPLSRPRASDLISARISSSRTQALSRSGSTARSGGLPGSAGSETQAQRDAKLHWSATSSGAGTEPSIATSRLEPPLGRGLGQQQTQCVRVQRLALERRGRRSTSTSEPAYSTYTRCATENATRRSWVMRMSPIPRACCTCFSRSRISACVVTSSAVDGSSAIRMPGIGCERSRETDPLAHPAGELERVAVGRRRVGDAHLREPGDRLRSAPPCDRGSARPRESRSTSSMCFEQRSSGFSIVNGSWKIIEMLVAAQPCDLARACVRACRARRRRSRPPLATTPVGKQSDDRARAQGLAAAGLADDRDRLALVEAQVDSRDERLRVLPATTSSRRPRTSRSGDAAPRRQRPVRPP